MSLAFLVDNPNDLILVGDNGQVAKLSLNLIPVDEKGEELDEDNEIFDEFVDDPQDLLGKRINFLVTVRQVQLSVTSFEKLFIKFTLKLLNEQEELEEKEFCTSQISGA